MNKRSLSDINKIIVHCSDSSFGNASLIRQWHKERGFDDIGYHYVINNGYVSKGIYDPNIDGVIEDGRPLDIIGAHCQGHNRDSIGICLIGVRTFTWEQFKSLKQLLDALITSYNLYTTDVYGHYDFSSNKTCPNFNVKSFMESFYCAELD